MENWLWAKVTSTHTRGQATLNSLWIKVVKLNGNWWSSSSCFTFSKGEAVATAISLLDGILLVEEDHRKSSSDLQRENKWQRELQMRKRRRHYALQKAANFPLRLPFHQSIQSLQTVCTYSPLWVSNCPLGLGLYLQFQASTLSWTEANFRVTFSCIVWQQSCGGTLYKHSITRLTAISLNITSLGIFTFICQQVTLILWVLITPRSLSNKSWGQEQKLTDILFLRYARDTSSS